MNTLKADRLGFMQGRLSPLIDGKIQCFPWPYWQKEFSLARRHGWGLMEWTLDHDRIRENPLMTVEGQGQIRRLCSENEIAIPSLTGDFFMQRPFFRAEGRERAALFDALKSVVEACQEMGIGVLVLPLVDNSSLDEKDEDALMQGLRNLESLYTPAEMSIAFESDYDPGQLRAFVARLSGDRYKVNHDTGNSAALGFDYLDEMTAYGELIANVHIKDRPRDGTTVPLGEGDAELHGIIEWLEESGYSGNYIFQTARSTDGNHADILDRFRDYIRDGLSDGESGGEPGAVSGG